MAEKEKRHLVKLTIDEREIEVPQGTTVYEAAKLLSIDIPIFCYHDRMPPFGACRMCLVAVEKMGKLQTSCTLEAVEGMVVRTNTQDAVKEREGILELLLINHPLDCPICDRGGECPLQDQALKFGPQRSRFFEEKRRFFKPKPLGPVLMLDRERCIICARCTRFGEIISGDHALEFIDRGFKTEVGTLNDVPVESKFIGNTIMICPVGALTSRVYRFRARPWDNDSAESTCTLCPVGCSMILDSRDGEIVRTRSKENREINDIWLCDKGWFGYEFASHPDRLQKPLIKRDGKLKEGTWKEALSLIKTKIDEFQPSGEIAGWGGIPLTIEENFLFQSLMRDVLKTPHVDYRVGLPLWNLSEEGYPPGMETSLGQCEDLSFAFLLGIDLTEEFPLLWLRLKQAINRGGQALFLGHFSPEISKDLSQTILHPPGKELFMIKKHLYPFLERVDKEKKGALFIGRQFLNGSNRLKILSELETLRGNFPNLTLNILEGKGNSLGARFGGMHPELRPLGMGAIPAGMNVDEVFQKALDSGFGYLHIAGANPAAKFPSALWQKMRRNLRFLVVQDLFLTETAAQADVILPTLSFLEKNGSFMNIEGRIQKVQRGKKLPEEIYSDGDIFKLIAESFGEQIALTREFEESLQEEIWKQSKNRIEVSQGQEEEIPLAQGEFLATFSPFLFDQGVRMKHNPHLIQLAKKTSVRIHPEEGAKYQLFHGDKVHIRTLEGTISGELEWDKGVAEKTAVLPLGFSKIAVHDLGLNLRNGMVITITKEA